MSIKLTFPEQVEDCAQSPMIGDAGHFAVPCSRTDIADIVLNNMLHNRSSISPMAGTPTNVSIGLLQGRLPGGLQSLPNFYCVNSNKKPSERLEQFES